MKEEEAGEEETGEVKQVKERQSNWSWEASLERSFVRCRTEVGVDEFRQVNVAQCAHENLDLRFVGLGALHAAGDAQDALDRAQPPVVVHLLRE